MAAPSGEWAISDELAQRLGCGVAASVILPVWFLMVLFVVDDPIALTVSSVVLVLTVVVAGLALRRARRVPRAVRLDNGVLTTEARSGKASRPVADLARVDLGTSLGVWPLRLTFADGSVLRLPRDLDDLDGFLDALRASRPGLPVVDHNPPEPPGPAEARR
jgi:hypothetical protein